MTKLTTFTPAFKSTHSGAARLERAFNYFRQLLAKWKEQREAARANEEMWAFAYQDPRLMAEIESAKSSGK
jgi:hypothetical protein